jgi:rubrerythrin
MNTRRDFFRVAGLTTAAGGGAAFLAACGDDDDDENGPVEGVTPTERDIRLLNEALDLENTAIVAYTAGAALLKGEALAVGKQFLEHEQEHAEGLKQAIKDLGGTPNRPRRREEYLRQFPNLMSQEDVLRFAVDLENVAVEAYLDSLPKLSTGELRQTAAAIVSNEAEHISVLLGALNPGDPAAQVPDAFVTGVASTS